MSVADQAVVSSKPSAPSAVLQSSVWEVALLAAGRNKIDGQRSLDLIVLKHPSREGLPRVLHFFLLQVAFFRIGCLLRELTLPPSGEPRLSEAGKKGGLPEYLAATLDH